MLHTIYPIGAVRDKHILLLNEISYKMVLNYIRRNICGLMFLLVFTGIHQIPVMLSIYPSIIAQLCLLIYTQLLLKYYMHTQLNIFPIYTNKLCNNPAMLYKELEYIIILVTEHRHIEIYSVFISDDYSLVVSTPKMIRFYPVLKSYLVHILNSLPNWNVFKLIFCFKL